MSTNLQKLRKSLDLTQQEFVDKYKDKIHIFKLDTLQSYEQGRRDLPIDVAIKISTEFCVTLDWLYCQKEYANDNDMLTQILVALRKVFKVKNKHTHNGWDTVLLVDYRFRNFIANMNKLVSDYSDNPRIEEKMYLQNLKDIYNEQKVYLSQIFGTSSFNEEKALEIHEIANMDGFVLDNNFFGLLGVEDMQKKVMKNNDNKLEDENEKKSIR